MTDGGIEARDVAAAGAPGPPTPPRWSVPPPRRRHPGATAAAVAVLVVLAVALAGAVVRLPYVIVSPGSATPVRDVVRVSGAPTYQTRPSILFLTVSVSTRRPDVWRTLKAWLDDDEKLIREGDYLQGQTRQQDEQAGIVMMQQSQLAAQKVALQALGYTVPTHGTGAQVAAVENGAPADGRLRVGDVIVAVDGTPVATSEELGPLVRKRLPGATVVLTVERDGTRTDVTVTTGAAPSGANQGQAYLGIATITRDLSFDFPVDVRIDTGDVSGPSAGLAFTLEIIDLMTPGDLTGGHRVAVTGTIDGSGNVGEVGGVPQKAAVARAAHADLMIVPAKEVHDARSRVGKGTKVVGVETLDDALAALRAAGGAPVERVAGAAA